MKTISEIQIVPVKPDKGLVGFCSFILYESIYCSSVAIFTRPDGSFRLVYPTKKVGELLPNNITNFVITGLSKKKNMKANWHELARQIKSTILPHLTCWNWHLEVMNYF